MPRLFVAAWPPAHVVDRLAALDRPRRPGVRWSRPDQWHVTLHFLGDVPAHRLDAVIEAMSDLRSTAAEAQMGPATARLGRSVLMAPVRGLDHVAAEVRERLSGLVPARGPERSFRGHLTLARARDASELENLTGAACAAKWRVGEVAVVASHLGSGGARYESLAVAPLLGV